MIKTVNRSRNRTRYYTTFTPTQSKDESISSILQRCISGMLPDKKYEMSKTLIQSSTVNSEAIDESIENNIIISTR